MLQCPRDVQSQHADEYPSAHRVGIDEQAVCGLLSGASEIRDGSDGR